MTVKISGNSEDNFKTKAIHEPSQSQIFTAAPLDNGGDASTFSPTDLLVVALATCVTTTADLYAKKHNLNLKNTTFSAEKIMATGIPRRIGKIVLHISFFGTFTTEQFEKLRTAAGRCPVKLSLHPDVEVEEHFSYVEQK
jgi:putative redox protein